MSRDLFKFSILFSVIIFRRTPVEDAFKIFSSILRHNLPENTFPSTAGVVEDRFYDSSPASLDPDGQRLPHRPALCKIHSIHRAGVFPRPGRQVMGPVEGLERGLVGRRPLLRIKRRPRRHPFCKVQPVVQKVLVLCTARRAGTAGGVRRGAGDRKAGKAIDPVLREIEGQQDGPVTVLCGDEDPVARATVHSPTGSWGLGGRGIQACPVGRLPGR